MKIPCEILEYEQVKDKLHIVIAAEISDGSDIAKFVKNGSKNASLQLDDRRYISSLQRRKIYANISDIAYFCGEIPEYAKEILKFLYITETGAHNFSLSNCSVETARDYMSYLIEFALRHDIPLSDPALQRTDDIERYLHSCIRHKKCCICGDSADIHHIDAIGMGRDRKHYNDSAHRKMALCRQHHSEAHSIGTDSFCEKHHVFGVIYISEEKEKG